MRSLVAAAPAAVLLGQLVFAPAHAADRPLSTDRPDRTESPFSVPKGWLQVESDVASWGRLENTDETVTSLSVMAFNAKYGLARNLDVQFLFTPWADVETESGNLPAEEDNGTGQAGLRLKYNLAGNDEGGSAIALLPFAFIPTRGDPILDAVTWGMMAPVSVDLGSDRAMSAMAGMTRVDNEDWWVTGSISLGSPIAGDLAGFIEVYVARAGFEQDASSDVTFDAGLTYGLNPNWQLDTGFYHGVTSTSERWRVFVGASARFDLSRK